MTTDFRDRERAFESKWAHDAELRFKVEARRNKLLGLWAAEIFGLSDDEAEAYAQDVVAADMKEAGDNDVFEKVKADFESRGSNISDHQLRRTMDEKLEEAKRQLQAELKG